jgi:glycine cleavage system aminomethyltransferase T
MNLDFLTAGAGAADGAVARSPMEGKARAAGAEVEIRNGWGVAMRYRGVGPEAEAASARRTAGWADVSHLGKLELQGPPEQLDRVAGDCGAELRLGESVRAGDAWWCRLTTTRALVVCDTHATDALRAQLAEASAGAEGVTLADVTTNFAALTLVGPLAREVFARFCALDLRPAVTPVRSLRPGSIGRQPGILICEAEDRYLFLFGWATGEYMWSVVADAGEHLGGRPIGVDALSELPGLGGDGYKEEETVRA